MAIGAKRHAFLKIVWAWFGPTAVGPNHSEGVAGKRPIESSMHLLRTSALSSAAVAACDIPVKPESARPVSSRLAFGGVSGSPPASPLRP